MLQWEVSQPGSVLGRPRCSDGLTLLHLLTEGIFRSEGSRCDHGTFVFNPQVDRGHQSHDAFVVVEGVRMVNSVVEREHIVAGLTVA